MYTSMLLILVLLFFSIRRRPHRSTLFPYTTLFRSCRDVQELIHGYVDGELDLVRNLEMERHLHECAACAGLEVAYRSEEHTSELQSPMYLVCRLLLEKKKT